MRIGAGPVDVVCPCVRSSWIWCVIRHEKTDHHDWNRDEAAVGKPSHLHHVHGERRRREGCLWGAESHPPNQMTDRGWNSATLKPGDVIVITVFPSKIGTTRGLLSKVVMNGKVLLDDTGRGAQE